MSDVPASSPCSAPQHPRCCRIRMLSTYSALLSVISLSAATALPTAQSGTVVAVLGGHLPDAWSMGRCTSSTRSLASCNLEVFRQAIATARDNDVGLLVLPEGYATVGSAHSFIEPIVSKVGDRTCDHATANASSPQQYALSCMASTYSVPLAANVFVSLPNGTNRILSIVYDAFGKVKCM